MLFLQASGGVSGSLFFFPPLFFYNYGLFPNGDYYEEIRTDGLMQGGIKFYKADNTLLYQTPSGMREWIIDSYEGKVLVLCWISSFTEDTWKIYMVDYNGKKAGQEHDVSEYGTELLDNQRYSNLGSGILRMAESIFFNFNTDNIVDIDTSEWRDFISFTDGITLWNHDDRSYEGSTTGYHLISVNDMADTETFKRKTANLGKPFEKAINAVDEKQNNLPLSAFGEGKVLVDNKFYTYTGDFVCEIPNYGERVQIYDITPFQSGYSILFLKGADDYCYVTVIDKNGSQQYEPINLEIYGMVNGWYDQGYMLYRTNDETYHLITPSGEIKKLDIGHPKGMDYGCIYSEKYYIRVNNPENVIYFTAP